ncbi:DUF6279 family lipoprotein [Pseudidiomarina homiensis]|uniref:DUF6279 family lipoprotein n=1 Tax=Pseudidiomarina homiensis TaxID=364198 RepID=UPI00215B199A|nr:DUF6279 family lipoprotein [Pseudidiomarina homiensis]
MTKWKTIIIIVLVFSAFLTGCSTQFGYRFADTYLEWQLAKYVDVSGQLETDVDTAIDELHMWHARSELPRYRDFLDTMLDDLEHGAVDAQRLFDYGGEVFHFWQRIRNQITPYAQEFLPRLNATQRTQLIKNLRDRLQEERKEAQELTDDERFERSYDRAVERASDWLGRVHPEQRRLLRRWVQERDNSDELWLDYQAQWLNRFEEILAEPQAETFAAELHDLFTQPEQLRSEELHAQNAENRELAVAVILVIYQSLSSQQKQHLEAKLREYRATLTDLINEFAVTTD